MMTLMINANYGDGAININSNNNNNDDHNEYDDKDDDEENDRMCMKA